MKCEYDVINYVYKNAEMGMQSTKTLIDTLKNKDNKIGNVLEDIYNSYEQFFKESSKVLKEMDEKGTKFGPVATISADMGIKMQVLKDNSDSAIADMLIKGLTMGELEMTKLYDKIDCDVSNNIKDIINDFKDFQSNAIVKLKNYL